jgi:hypothetical protein
MPTDKPESISAKEHMTGIMQQIQAGPRDPSRINDLKVYLTEIDRRRGTNWQELFPWLNQDWSRVDSYSPTMDNDQNNID